MYIINEVIFELNYLLQEKIDKLFEVQIKIYVKHKFNLVLQNKFKIIDFQTLYNIIMIFLSNKMHSSCS